VGNQALTPARLVGPARLPRSGFLNALRSLLVDPASCKALANDIPDSRLAPDHFRRVLVRELFELYAWSARRIRLASTAPRADANDPAQVLSLLPARAHAVHVIRRAAPFAALGVRVECAFRAECAEAGQEVVARLARALRIEDTLVPAQRPPERVVAVADQSTLIVVTGRVATVDSIRHRTRGSVIGATGRCSIVAGRVKQEVERLASIVEAASPSDSCTRPGGALVINSWSSTSTATQVAPGKNRAKSLESALRSFHPSVIFTPAESEPAPAEFVSGYRIIRCDDQGASESSTGLGADPMFGWPGDHLI
jgi:hypothetical protein